MGKCSSQIQDEIQYMSDIEESITRTFDFSHIDYSHQHDTHIITDYETSPDYPKHEQIKNQTDNVINNIISFSGKVNSSCNSNGLANNQAASNQGSNGHNDSNDSPNDKNHKKPNKGNNNPNKNGKPHNGPNENEKKQLFCPIPEHSELAKTVNNLRGDVKKLQQQCKNLNDKYDRLKSQREELCYNDDEEKRNKLDKEETRCPIEKKQQCVNETDEFMEQEFISKIVFSRTNSNTNNIDNLGVSIKHHYVPVSKKKKKKKFINKKNKRSFNITGSNTKDSNPNDNQTYSNEILPIHNAQTVKRDKVSTRKSKMSPTEDNPHCISKHFTKKILPKKAKEKFDQPYEYMKQFEQLYSNQFIKWYCNGTIGIINYNIHCLKTGKPLYVVYTLAATWEQYNKNTDSTLNTNSTKFTQIDCYTEHELKQLCPEIKSELLAKPLPTISIQYIQKSLIPQLQINAKRNIEYLLRDTERRRQLFENTKWTRLHVHQREPTTSAHRETIHNIKKEEFVSIVNAYLQELTHVQLIPIIPYNSKQIEYALVVPFGTFHVAVAFRVNKENKTELKEQDMDEKELYNDEDEDKIIVSAIYLSIYDAHQLVQAHHKQECKILEAFQYSVNYLQIGTNKKMQMSTIKKLRENNKNLKKERKQWNEEKNELIRQQKQQMIINQKVLEQENNDHQRTINALQTKLNKNKQLKDQQQTINALHQQLNYVSEQHQLAINCIEVYSKLLEQQTRQ